MFLNAVYIFLEFANTMFNKKGLQKKYEWTLDRIREPMESFIYAPAQFKLYTMKHILVTEPISVSATTSKALIPSVWWEMKPSVNNFQVPWVGWLLKLSGSIASLHIIQCPKLLPNCKELNVFKTIV